MTDDDKALEEELMNMKASRHCQVLKALARIRELSAENERLREQLRLANIDAIQADIENEQLCDILEQWLATAREHLDTEVAGRTFEALRGTK